MPKASPLSINRAPTNAIAIEGLKLITLPRSCCKIRPIGAEKSIIGTVPKPKKLIYKVDCITLGIAVAAIKAKYTKPQGIKPFSNPKVKATSILSDDNSRAIDDLSRFKYLELTFDENTFFLSPLGNRDVRRRILPTIRKIVFWVETILSVLPINPNTIPSRV